MPNIKDGNISAIQNVEQGTTPDTPGAGKSRIFSKSDGFYIVNDSGEVTKHVVNTPTTAAQNIIQPSADITALTIQSHASQTVDNSRFGDVTSGDYSAFEDDGTLRFEGEAITYDDLPPVPIISAKLGATAPTLTTFVGNIEQYIFDATNDYVIGSTEVTHKYKEATDINLHIHWATNGTDGTDRAVKWQIEYTISNGDGSAPFTSNFASSTTVSAETTIPASTADRAHIISSIATITGTAITIGAYIVWRLERITAAGTAPSSDPFAIAVGFHVQQDTTGSRELFVK